MGFMTRLGYLFSPQEMCWQRRPDGTRCVFGLGHPGPHSLCVNRVAYDRLCRVIGWEVTD